MYRLSLDRTLLFPAPSTRAPAAPALPRQKSPRFPLPLLSILFLAALIRLVGLSRLDLGTDEAHSFLTITSPRGILAELQNDTNLPLYFFILKAWAALFGTSLQAMRLLSALCGVAAVAALTGFARQIGASRQTIAWTLLLAALSPVQLHYAQLARGYTLCALLLTLGLWSFVNAVQSRRPAAWLLHAAVVALGFWTHALFAPVALGYLLSALLMRLPLRTLRDMTLAYALATILALPALLLTLHQAHASGGASWLRDYWLATPPALAIPKSLALLALGGDMPRYLLTLPLARPMQWIALALTALAVAAFFWPRRNPPQLSDADEKQIGRWRWLVIVFTFWPLLFIWCYSWLISPIYLVGRYDLFAQPAYLILLALGLSRAQHAAAPRIAAWVLPLMTITVLAAGIGGRWFFPLDPQVFHHQARVDYLAGVIQPGEGIVCTGLEASPTMYWLRQRGIDAPVQTVPSETMDHVGWLNDDAALWAKREAWPAEILAALNAASHGGRDRVWILMDGAAWNWTGDFAPTPRQALALSVLPVAVAHGWRLVEGGTGERALRMVRLERE